MRTIRIPPDAKAAVVMLNLNRGKAIPIVDLLRATAPHIIAAYLRDVNNGIQEGDITFAPHCVCPDCDHDDQLSAFLTDLADSLKKPTQQTEED